MPLMRQLGLRVGVGAGVAYDVGRGVAVDTGVATGVDGGVVDGVGVAGVSDGLDAGVSDGIDAEIAGGAGFMDGLGVGVSDGAGAADIWVAVAGVWARVMAIVGVRAGAGVCVAVGVGVSAGVCVAVDVGMRVGDAVGAGAGMVGSGAAVVALGVGVWDCRVARFASGGGVVVALAGGVGVEGWRSDSRMIVKVGVGCGSIWVVAGLVCVMGAGMGVGGVGAPPQFSRVSAVSSVVARDRAARIFG